MITIFTDTKNLEVTEKAYLFPVLRALLFDDKHDLHQWFSLTTDSNLADVIIVPFSYDHLIKIKRAAIYCELFKIAKSKNKKIWVGISGDLPLKIKDKSVYTFTLTQNRSEATAKNIVMPVFIDDPLIKFYNHELQVIPKTNIPKIGYVGHAKSGFVKALRTIFIYLKYNYQVLSKNIISDFSPLYFSSHVRFAYLKILEKSKRLDCDFVYRDRYRAGAKSKAEYEKTTKDFFENIRNTQYTFCIRGGGNFSVRLFETLAMGRIPVQVDTDSKLPLEEFLDWEKYSISLPESKIKTAAEVINQFHANLSASDFEKLQNSCRDFWLNNLTLTSYFKTIHNLFIEKKL